MRLVVAVGLVAAMSGSDIERAQTLSRGRQSERQQFHARYIIDLRNPVVTQIEIVTEFRRLVTISEDHILRGDWMFTRSVRAAQEALAPARGRITLKALVRFNPLNAYVEAPPYTLAIGDAQNSPLRDIDTQLAPQFSVPFRTKDGETLTSLLGANLEAMVSADRIGQTARPIGVTLKGQEIVRSLVNFGSLD